VGRATGETYACDCVSLYTVPEVQGATGETSAPCRVVAWRTSIRESRTFHCACSRNAALQCQTLMLTPTTLLKITPAHQLICVVMQAIQLFRTPCNMSMHCCVACSHPAGHQTHSATIGPGGPAPASVSLPDGTCVVRRVIESDNSCLVSLARVLGPTFWQRCVRCQDRGSLGPWGLPYQKRSAASVFEHRAGAGSFSFCLNRATSPSTAGCAAQLQAASQTTS
jgi:hypothetical protein